MMPQVLLQEPWQGRRVGVGHMGLQPSPQMQTDVQKESFHLQVFKAGPWATWLKEEGCSVPLILAAQLSHHWGPH